MSAHTLNQDWRTARAITALTHGTDIDLDVYAVELDMDPEDVLELFEDAARNLGMELEIKEERVLH